MKLPLLLIPLIFLSSCTIDWNDEKDAKIAELKKEIQELKSDKEFEMQKFDFEKQKYEESKETKEQEREDKFKKECVSNYNTHMENVADILNKNCTTKECVDKLLADGNLQLPPDYVDNCLQRKLDGTWKGN